MWLSRGSNIGNNNKNLCRIFSSEILINQEKTKNIEMFKI